MTLTLDGASVNDTLCAGLARILAEKFDIQFGPANSRIFCLAHVVNLVVQKILNVFNEADDPDLEDYHNHSKSFPVHYNAEDDPSLTELEAEPAPDGPVDTAEEDADVDMMNEMADELRALSALRRLRFVCIKICSSPQRRARFRVIAQTKYPTTKNSKGVRLALLMVIRDAIDAWVFDRRELRSLMLNNADWDLLEALGNLLKPFTSVTLQMSKRSTPTLPWVLPMYDIMSSHLEDARDNSSYPEVLRTAADAGLTKLNEYYPKAQENQFNVIATLLHPSLAAGFFASVDAQHKAKGRPASNMLEKATILFTHAFESYKREYDNEKAHSAQTAVLPPAINPTSITMAASSNARSSQRSKNKLEDFWHAVEDYGAGEEQSPLTWWKDHGSNFPVASRMARDFLAIPGTSVSVERLFSQARNVCRDTRSSLKAATIKEAMLTKLWIKAGYFDL
ncbi:unnamed protein product [Mycena citricolor]|uniref:HAT C-terminal dimerisation domain-containing protein n=1 Tax=Mycena citricolor TaxID=2018698 RepID=A0AAD2JUC8_9AGAR|nr:unnamed protein product [Mycena citricolor]